MMMMMMMMKMMMMMEDLNKNDAFVFNFQSVSFNSEMTEFSITGTNATEIENLVREVAYVNARSFPTPGRRNLNIRTNIQ